MEETIRYYNSAEAVVIEFLAECGDYISQSCAMSERNEFKSSKYKEMELVAMLIK